MDGRTKRNALDDAAANEGDRDDAMDPAIPETVLAAFLVALTGAIITAVSTAVSTVRTAPNPRYLMAIDPFDTKSIDLTSRDGRGKRYKAKENTGR